MYRHFFKPVLDFLMSLVGFIILSPVFLILIIAIKIDSRGPILFKQQRVGKNKKLFKIYKFRTMRIDTPKDTPTHLLENPDQYITKVGRFLRKTSLDELPQILNILGGKMSVIGPRPALWNQDDLIAERDKAGANSIRPGLTGWAQVNGRDELPIPDKAALDGEYVRKCGFFFDIKVFFLTVGKVFKHEGVVEGGTGALKPEGSAQDAAAREADEAESEAAAASEPQSSETNTPDADGFAQNDGRDERFDPSRADGETEAEVNETNPDNGQ